MVAPVYSLRVGHNELQLFSKLLQPARWISTGSYANFGVSHTGLRIFIVDGISLLRRFIIFQLHLTTQEGQPDWGTSWPDIRYFVRFYATVERVTGEKMTNHSRAISTSTPSSISKPVILNTPSTINLSDSPKELKRLNLPTTHLTMEVRRAFLYP